MNANAKKWIKALRSGKYGRGKLKLFNTVNYCCLGVACAVYQKENKDLAISIKKENIVSFDGATTALPEKVKKWLGLRNRKGIIRIPFMTDLELNSLTRVNDWTNLTFPEIAALIEQNEDQLFVRGKK
jgi:hypothetical protein